MGLILGRPQAHHGEKLVELDFSKEVEPNVRHQLGALMNGSTSRTYPESEAAMITRAIAETAARYKYEVIIYQETEYFESGAIRLRRLRIHVKKRNRWQVLFDTLQSYKSNLLRISN